MRFNPATMKRTEEATAESVIAALNKRITELEVSLAKQRRTEAQLLEQILNSLNKEEMPEVKCSWRFTPVRDASGKIKHVDAQPI